MVIIGGDLTPIGAAAGFVFGKRAGFHIIP